MEMSHADRRNQIIQFIKRAVASAAEVNKEFPKDKLVAEVSLKFGSSKRTILEYLSILEGVGFLSVERNQIVLNAVKEQETIEEEADEILKGGKK